MKFELTTNVSEIPNFLYFRQPSPNFGPFLYFQNLFNSENLFYSEIP